MSIEIVHGSHAVDKMSISAMWHLQGPQPVGAEGGCPEWVAKAMEENEDIELIAIQKKDYKTVGQLITGLEKQGDSTRRLSGRLPL